MNIQRWIARREPDWKRLDTLLKQVERKGLKSLKADEIKLLASLYRSVSADLARIRRNPVSRSLAQELQLLTSRGYNQIYQGSRRQEWNSALEFCLWGFPATVQRNFAYIALAIALFLVGALIAWWFCWRDPAFMALVVPEELISKVRDRGELWMGSIVGVEPLASSGIMINNISVSLFAVFGGVTMFLPELSLLTPPGVFTAYLLFNNGLLIGAVSTLVGQNNLAYPFWAFVLPHGSLELPAIFFAGGAGLLLARGILFPGKYRRPDALRYYGMQAAQLICGIIPMLVIAGVIEGFFSPNPAIPDPLKYLVGITLFTLLVVYCSRQKQVVEGQGNGVTG
ncbi:MAG: stage II sporulation protein M [Oculatellaceae cyanobacterium bins.114]|nr:stage II sporulation protein M [Oculatellaceae cyanobacterium bins.114]